MDQPAVRIVVLELAAQPVDGHPDDVPSGRVVVSPDVLRERGGRNDRVAVAHQVFEKPKLSPGQPQDIALKQEGALGQVEPQ